MASEICGLPTQQDKVLINKISQLDPALNVFVSGIKGQAGGAEITVADKILAGLIMAIMYGVSIAAIQTLMVPQVAAVIGVTPPCSGTLAQVFSAIGAVGKSCAQRQAEFDTVALALKTALLGLPFTAIVAWVAAQRAACQPVPAATAGGRRRKSRTASRRSASRRTASRSRRNRK